MSKRANIIAIAVLVGLMLALELLPVSRFLAQQPARGTAIPADTLVIRFGGGESFAYNPLNLTIPAGSSVEWQGNLSVRLRSRAPGNSPASVRIWKPLQMPST